MLGPTTNIALAISLDATFVQKVKHFYVMGGSMIGYGNRGPGIEFNFGADAESNFIFFNSTQRVATLLLPWETNVAIQIPTVKYEKFRMTSNNLLSTYFFVFSHGEQMYLVLLNQNP